MRSSSYEMILKSVGAAGQLLPTPPSPLRESRASRDWDARGNDSPALFDYFNLEHNPA